MKNKQDYVKITKKILKELHKSCQTSEGIDDQRKGTQLLEVYALEIQMHTLQKNTKKLKQLIRIIFAYQSSYSTSINHGFVEVFLLRMYCSISIQV